MSRALTLRVPVALLAAGTVLLGGCAQSGTNASWPLPGQDPTPGAASGAAGSPAGAPAATSGPATPTAAPPATTALPTLTAPALTPVAPTTPNAPLPSSALTTDGPGPLTIEPPDRAARTVQRPVAGGKTLYLTFDDGPNGAYTRAILRLLDQYDAKATFFVVGKSAEPGRSLVRAEYAAGHGVANHTWDHTRLRGASLKTYRAQVQRTQRAIEAAIGRPATCLRPPGGATDQRTRPRAKAYGLDVTMWSTDTYDWKQPGAKVIADRIMRGARDGAIILLHDGGGDRRQTISALKATLPKLKRAGYTFAAMCR